VPFSRRAFADAPAHHPKAAIVLKSDWRIREHLYCCCLRSLI